MFLDLKADAVLLTLNFKWVDFHSLACNMCWVFVPLGFSQANLYIYVESDVVLSVVLLSCKECGNVDFYLFIFLQTLHWADKAAI